MKLKIVCVSVVALFLLAGTAQAYYRVPYNYARQRSKELSRSLCERTNCLTYSWGCAREGRSRVLCRVQQEYEEPVEPETCFEWVHWTVVPGAQVEDRIGPTFCNPGSIEP